MQDRAAGHRCNSQAEREYTAGSVVANCPEGLRAASTLHRVAELLQAAQAKYGDTVGTRWMGSPLSDR